MIVVLNHGQGNIGSLTNTLSYLGKKYEVWANVFDEYESKEIEGFILPGVGSFNSGMREMRKRSLDKVIYSLIKKQIKGMGICLGMQMLCEGSEEGKFTEKGLGIFKGDVRRLSTEDGFVPSIGWHITTEQKDIEKILGKEEKAFYYVHSYAVETKNTEDIVATYKHGGKKITAAIYKSMVLGVQFHPEKSQEPGLNLLETYFS